jgi:uncharacterized membrane protein YdjX (TVP38/TMEM64 family)
LKESLLQLFEQYPNFAFAISVFLNIIIAILGVLPSVFITAANILFFGFWKGTFISFIGEAIGALIAFLLYRKGFKQSTQASLQKHPTAQRLINAEGKQAFNLILCLRLLPFVPSGLVSFAAAVGKVSTGIFFIASSLGKLPAIFIEAYSVNEVTKFGWQGKVILSVVAVFLVYVAIKKLNRKK